MKISLYDKLVSVSLWCLIIYWWFLQFSFLTDSFRFWNVFFFVILKLFSLHFVSFMHRILFNFCQVISSKNYMNKLCVLCFCCRVNTFLSVSQFTSFFRSYCWSKNDYLISGETGKCWVRFVAKMAKEHILAVIVQIHWTKVNAIKNRETTEKLFHCL